MNWGRSIILAFVLFAAFIASLVVICARQDVSLVTRNYYEEELRYQQQIDRIVDTDKLEVKPQIEVEKGVVKISYPDFGQIQEGALVLFRPSDASQDRVFELTPSRAPVQYFPTEGLSNGMYRAKLKWTMNGKEFYLEQVVEL